ncbi:MAG: hypothetical protein HKN56_02945 [Gammaproteobacteria bacterium]|nr:hypothetical protein [Gammaproteobacteria bacterium]
MSVYLFPLYSFAHFLIVIWCIRSWRKYRAPGALITLMIAGALVYDNAIVSFGSAIGISPLLEGLSWPRFAMHALGTPFMIIAVTHMGQAGGIRWTKTRAWTIVAWLLVIGGIIEGVFAHLIGLQLEPACMDGVVRYTSNVNPGQFCFEGQEAGPGGSPPIPSILGNLVALVIGFSLWRSTGWVWLMVGSVLMFAAASVPPSGFGLAPGNGGEVLLMLAFAATAARFGRRTAMINSA